MCHDSRRTVFSFWNMMSEHTIRQPSSHFYQTRRWCVMVWWEQDNKMVNLSLENYTPLNYDAMFSIPHHLFLCLSLLSRLWVQSWPRPGMTPRKRRTTCCMLRTSGQAETSTKPCARFARATPSSVLMSLSPCEPGRRVDTTMKRDS